MVPTPGRQKGFSLVEVAVSMAIIALVLASGVFALTAQQDTRRFADTQSQLEQARELLLAYAAKEGRLPCPATSAAGTGDEQPVGGGTCTTNFAGFLPGKTIGYQPVDANGYALDAWGFRIRYAVSALTWSTAGNFTTQHSSSNVAVKWALNNTPADIKVCSNAVASATACDANSDLAASNVVVAVVYSLGKNGGIAGGSGINEQRNQDGNGLFVSRVPDPTGTANAGGEFDDQVVWIPATLLYARMLASGVLP